LYSDAQGSGMLGIVPGIVGYVSLFAYTIWRYRKNRAIVLGVVTVCLFFLFILSDELSNRQKYADWVNLSVIVLIVLTGLVVLVFVGVDVVQWLRNARAVAVQGENYDRLNEPKTK
jgi:hypothetical protein